MKVCDCGASKWRTKFNHNEEIEGNVESIIQCLMCYKKYPITKSSRHKKGFHKLKDKEEK